MEREESVQHFLDLIKKSRRGKFKIYIGMIAGVGKTYRMLQEARELLDNGVDVRIGLCGDTWACRYGGTVARSAGDSPTENLL